MKGFILAAASSNSGKTTLSLGIQRLLSRQGLNIRPAKCGPDYIDPAFHKAASGQTSINLDPWAMGEEDIRARASRHAMNGDLLFIEGVMGLFDGAANGAGSTAKLARILDLPVVLVVDVKGQAQTAAAIARGLVLHDRDIKTAGVILNRVGSIHHENLLREAFDESELAIVGIVRNNPDLSLPSRHLGLIQAEETEELTAFIDSIADHMAPDIDLDVLSDLSKRAGTSTKNRKNPLPPLGQHIAIAQDKAFSFIYPHLLQDWKEAGAKLSFFSPLSDEAPASDADAIYLPGGYPELHLDKLEKALNFKQAMREAARRDCLVFGECGGYMVLGDAILDKDGQAREMLGLLPLTTSFETPKLSLGYRKISHQSHLPWPRTLLAHEFHYATIVSQEAADLLFVAENASGRQLGSMGLQRGLVFGSFAHIIAPSE